MRSRAIALGHETSSSPSRSNDGGTGAARPSRTRIARCSTVRSSRTRDVYSTCTDCNSPRMYGIWAAMLPLPNSITAP